MQMQASSKNTTSTTTETTATPLDTKALAKLDELMLEIEGGGDYFKTQNGQSQEITFNLEDSPGMKTRVIHTDDGGRNKS